MILLRAADRVAVPWKNGGGVTREVATFPPGAGMADFGWRVSIADVAAAGPFSRFDGVDRVLTVLEGGLRLEFAGAAAAIVLGPGDRHSFAGEAAVTGIPVGGAVRDLNVMVRRGSWSARIEPFRSDHVMGEVRIAIALQSCGAFEPLDALLMDSGDELPPGFIGHLVRLGREEGR